MGVLWDKVWRDLWENKGRTLQVVLIIAVGTFAIGMIIGTRQFMITGMQLVWGMSSPATIYLWSSPGIDDETPGRPGPHRRRDGHRRHAAGSRSSGGSRPTTPGSPAGLNARDDYDEQTLSRYDLISGEWPHKKVLGIGQGGDAAFGIDKGETPSTSASTTAKPVTPSAASSTIRTCSRPALAATPSFTPRANSSAT